MSPASLAVEMIHMPPDMNRGNAVDVVYWPTPDPTVATGTREQILSSYRDVRDMLALRLRKLFAIEPPTD